MKKLLIASALTVSFISAAFADPLVVKAKSISGQTMDAVAGQVIVKYRKGRTANAQASLHQAFAIQSFKPENPLEAEVLKVPAGETIDSFISKLKDDPNVEFAEPNGIVRANFIPNDTNFASSNTSTGQWYLHTGYLDMPHAWDITRGSANVIVAVLDTGSLYTDPEFSGQFAAGTGATMEIDWNDNGNTTEDFGCTNGGLGKEQTQHDGDPKDDNYDDCSVPANTGIYHGTRTSSLIGAATNNAAGIAGVAHGCKLLAVKVLNNKGIGPFSSVADGIVWATTSGAKVINMSLGSSSSSSLMNTAVKFALDHDVVVVAAAGNEAPCTVEYPGAIDGVIAVGATNSSDGLASFSCTGNSLDLVAPGVSILSLTSANALGTPSTFNPLSGTSFSSPLTAGVAALIRSIAPSLTYLQVTQYLDYFSDDLGPSGFDTSFGFGRLNAFKALTAVQNKTSLPSERSTPGKTFPAPNPFNPSAGPVSFYFPNAVGSPNSTNPLGFELKVMDLVGETIKTLDASCLDSQGLCHWDGRNEKGNYVASGFYLYRAKTSAGGITGKLTVVEMKTLPSSRRKPGSRFLRSYGILRNLPPAFAGLFLIFSSPLHAGIFVGAGGTGSTFLKIPISARADAMAGAFTGVSGDVAALEYNPAGLTDIERLDINATLIRYLEDSDLQALAIGFPVDFKKGPNLGEGFFGPDSDKIFLGFQYRAFKAQDTARDAIGTPLNDFDNKDQLINLGLGYSPFERLSLGLGGKLISSKLAGNSLTNFAADAGAIWKLTAQTSLGVSLLNMGPSKAYISEADPLPTTLRTGLAYEGSHVLLTGDLLEGRDNLAQEAVGAEFTINRYLRVRGGVLHHTDIEFSGGIGISFSPPVQKVSNADREKRNNKNTMEDLDAQPDNSFNRDNTSSSHAPLDFGIDYAIRSHNDLDATHTITLRILY